MTNFQCHYESLKVTPDAPPEVIRAAYRSLSQKHHPDKNSGNPEAARVMARLNLAYSVLSDAVQRELYDLQRQHARAAGVDPGTFAEDTPDAHTGRGKRSVLGWLYRQARGREGRILAMLVGALALVFAVIWWSIWNDQRSMLLLQQAAIAAPLARRPPANPPPSPLQSNIPPLPQRRRPMRQPRSSGVRSSNAWPRC